MSTLLQRADELKAKAGSFSVDPALSVRLAGTLVQTKETALGPGMKPAGGKLRCHCLNLCV